MFLKYKKGLGCVQIKVTLRYKTSIKYLRAFILGVKARKQTILFLRSPKHFKVGKQRLFLTQGTCYLVYAFKSLPTLELDIKPQSEFFFNYFLYLTKLSSGYGIVPTRFKVTQSLKIKFSGW